VITFPSLNGLVQTAVQARMEFITKTLRMRLSTQATYMMQNKDECHEATRDRVLRRLNEWLTVPSKTARCWWITGQPGVGKSAIAITVADYLRARRPTSAYTTTEDGSSYAIAENGYEPKATLVSQFFINRALSDTANPHNIFRQLLSI
jgi:DNA replication protein DnaC